MNLDKIILHEKFDKFTYDNDIALLRLAKHIKFTPTIRPACLPDREETYAVGTLCTVTGWGRLGEGKAGPDVLHTAKVRILLQISMRKRIKVCISAVQEMIGAFW